MVSITCGGVVLLITVIVAVRCLKAIQNRASGSSSSLALPIPLLSEEEQSNFNSNLDHSVPVSIHKYNYYIYNKPLWVIVGLMIK